MSTYKQVVAAPPASPPRYGLLVAANVIDDGERWQGGVEWAPEACTGGALSSFSCAGDGALVNAPNVATAEADPVFVQGWDRCSTLGWAARDFEGRARRMLEATQSYFLAGELWSGSVRDADTLDNPALVDATCYLSDDGAPASIVTAFRWLEEALGVKQLGRRGMIHCTQGALDAAHSAFLLEQAGQLWLTANGTIVVADAGYSGNCPSGKMTGLTTQWAYATSMVQVRLGPIEIIPGSLAEARARAQATNRATNLIELYAERPALIQMDPCTLCAVEIDLPRVPGGV